MTETNTHLVGGTLRRAGGPCGDAERTEAFTEARARRGGIAISSCLDICCVACEEGEDNGAHRLVPWLYKRLSSKKVKLT